MGIKIVSDNSNDDEVVLLAREWISNFIQQVGTMGPPSMMGFTAVWHNKEEGLASAHAVISSVVSTHPAVPIMVVPQLLADTMKHHLIVEHATNGFSGKPPDGMPDAS